MSVKFQAMLGTRPPQRPAAPEVAFSLEIGSGGDVHLMANGVMIAWIDAGDGKLWVTTSKGLPAGLTKAVQGDGIALGNATVIARDNGVRKA